MKKLILLLVVFVSLSSYAQENTLVSAYLDVIQKTGQEPVKFVNSLLDNYDLLIFDDAIHLAKEPFDFYQKLVKDAEFTSKIDYVFIEMFSITSQPLIDNYLNNPTKDSSILLPAFQDNYSGYGLRYKTYFDVLSTIWDVNAQLPEPEKIKVICVDQPIYWDAIKTREDYVLFQKSLLARDNFMYQIISLTLHNFKQDEKGIFLTNSRHAYKGIKASDGVFYWNTGTFFQQWNPGKTYSIRLHNVNLSIGRELKNTSNTSTEGLDRFSYKWIRISDGLWDRAFKENGNVPVAIPLENNVFGETPYIGNLMLDVAADQTMYDAYDAIIFLAPLEELHFSAKVSFIYTSAFIQELKRRIVLLEGDRLPDFLEENDSDSLDDFIREYKKYQGAVKNTLVTAETN